MASRRATRTARRRRGSSSSRSASADGRVGAFARYRTFVAGGGQLRPAPKGTADEAFFGDDKFSGRVFAARAGATVAISLGAQAEATAASRVAGCLRAAQGQDKR